MAKKTKPQLSEVVTIVVHQLKNPLAVIKGYLEVLLSEDFGEINEKQKEYLGDIAKNVELMGETVKDLLSCINSWVKLFLLILTAMVGGSEVI